MPTHRFGNSHAVHSFPTHLFGARHDVHFSPIHLFGAGHDSHLSPIHFLVAPSHDSHLSPTHFLVLPSHDLHSSPIHLLVPPSHDLHSPPMSLRGALHSSLVLKYIMRPTPVNTTAHARPIAIFPPRVLCHLFYFGAGSFLESTIGLSVDFPIGAVSFSIICWSVDFL